MKLHSIAGVPLVCEDCGQLITVQEALSMRRGTLHDCRAALRRLGEEFIGALEDLIAGQRAQIARGETELQRLEARLVRAREHLARCEESEVVK